MGARRAMLVCIQVPFSKLMQLAANGVAVCAHRWHKCPGMRCASANGETLSWS